MTISEKELTQIFGEESIGTSAAERARTSKNSYVRSQIQLARWQSHATGHKMTALEAYSCYGLDILRKVADDGAASLVSSSDEPAATLKARREALNLTVDRVAGAAGVSSIAVSEAETVGKVSPIRTLERIAQSLALDERQLGFRSGASGDSRLGVRLREMSYARDAHRFSATDVLGLAEAAWVIARQLDVSKLLFQYPPQYQTLFSPSGDYAWPTYRTGYALAQQAREMLGLSATEPVLSLRSLLEERLGIPVVQEAIGERFAGATIANGSSRGVLVNERGANSNVWVRRMTLAHELGHLLWDPDAKLDNLTVDDYADIEDQFSSRTDPVETRANAFAIAFLAPPEGINEIAKRFAHNLHEMMATIMNEYGISATAARYHVKNVAYNVAYIDFSQFDVASLPKPTDEWIARENLTVDYFRPESTPISRRGRFAWLIANAYSQNLVTDETAATWLKSKPADFVASVSFILSALSPTAV